MGQGDAAEAQKFLRNRDGTNNTVISVIIIAVYGALPIDGVVGD